VKHKKEMNLWPWVIEKGGYERTFASRKGPPLMRGESADIKDEK